MAARTINAYLNSKQFGEHIDKKVKAKLSSVGVEQYIFDKHRIIEWCSWCQEEINTILSMSLAGNSNRMMSVFYKTLEREFKKNVGDNPVHISMERNAMVITQLSQTAAGFQQGGNPSSAKSIKAAKEKALDVIYPVALKYQKKEDGTIKRTQRGNPLKTRQFDRLMGSMHGHHGGTRSPGPDTPITTGAVLKTRKDINTIANTKGFDLYEMSAEDRIHAVLDSVDQRTEKESLMHIMLTNLSDHIDSVLGFDRAPLKMIDHTGANFGKGNAIEVNNIIHIDFALGRGYGPGKIGTTYTAAFRDWDAGASGGFATKLQNILNRILNQTINDILRIAEKNAPDLLTLRGSPSVVDHVNGTLAKALVTSMFKHNTNPNMRFKVNKQLAALANNAKIKSTSVNGVRAKGKKKSNFKFIHAAALPKKTKKQRTQSRVAGKAGQNPLALRNMLNELLPVAVAANMTSPALNYRTGRFANSVRVTNVTQGPRGGNTMIEASYMTNPYETFAPGGDKYTPQRNPEKLIKRTLREVATGMIGAKFGVRVN